MAADIQGQASSVKGFTYELDDSSKKMFAFQAGVKENSEVWVKHYTSPAAFEATDSKFGATGQVSGLTTNVQSPNSAGENVNANDAFAVHQIPDGTDTNKNKQSFPPMGFVFDGTYYWARSTRQGHVYRFDDINDTDPTYKFMAPSNTNNNPREGLTFDGQYFWLPQRGSNTVYQFKKDGTELTNFSTAGIGGNPTDVAWDGSYIWVHCDSNGQVYRFTTGGTDVSSFANGDGSGNGMGITWDGTYLFVHNVSDNSAQQFKTDGTNVGSFSLPSGSTEQSFGWDGLYVYVGSGTAETVYQVSSSASLDLSYQMSSRSLVAAGTHIYQTLSETVTLNDSVSTGGLTDLTGRVYLSGSNVEGAYVFAVSKEQQHFGGATTTDGTGAGNDNFTISGLDVQYVWLVGVDFKDSNDNTLYGEEKSIDLDFE